MRRSYHDNLISLIQFTSHCIKHLTQQSLDTDTNNIDVFDYYFIKRRYEFILTVCKFLGKYHNNLLKSINFNLYDKRHLKQFVLHLIDTGKLNYRVKNKLNTILKSDQLYTFNTITHRVYNARYADMLKIVRPVLYNLKTLAK